MQKKKRKKEEKPNIPLPELLNKTTITVKNLFCSFLPLFPGIAGATMSFHRSSFKKKKDALYFSIYLITSWGWDT